jgi:arginine decarboxylase
VTRSPLPIWSALKSWLDRPNSAPFYTPGHKGGQAASPTLLKAWGDVVWRSDLPELPGLDNLQAPTGIIHTAQQLAAHTFGAEETWFLVNGSTVGIMAAICAVCKPGERILIPRNIHRSIMAGIIHAGAIPVLIAPEYDRDLDIAHGITSSLVKTALDRHPDIRAVLVVAPTYYGTCGDIAALAAIVHSYHLPLLVDEAHGAHLGFDDRLPPSALSQGADLVVQSTHKLLGALTQSAMLHLRGTRIDRERVSQCLQLFHTSSPNYLLLASLDGARQQMEDSGRELMARTVDLAQTARREIARIEGLGVFELEQPQAGCRYLDPTRLTVTVTGLNLTGFDADRILSEELGVVAELPSLRHLTFIISIGNTETDIDRLVQGLRILARSHRHSQPLELIASPPMSEAITTTQISPRDAFFSPHIAIEMEAAVGRISAELICPYPPGIPLLIPGETIDRQAIDYLYHIQAAGGEITGASDPSLATLKIVGDEDCTNFKE